MAKDPVRGIFVKEKPDAIRHSAEGKEYFFCSTQHLFHYYLAMFKDPVCKMMVDESTGKYISEEGANKVYLCLAPCKAQFDANPKKYGY
jgi:YHS domain-containing protein